MQNGSGFFCYWHSASTLSIQLKFLSVNQIIGVDLWWKLLIPGANLVVECGKMTRSPSCATIFNCSAGDIRQ